MVNSLVIIDDDPIMNEMLSDIATHQLHVPSQSFNSAEQFFDSAIVSRNCIYVVDWKLPGLQGPDIIKNIRSRDKISPIFMISGNHGREEILEGLRAGADDYLVKPFEPLELINKIQNARAKCNSILENFLDHGFKLIPEANLIIKHGEKVHLTVREFQVFNELYSHMNKVRSRSEIMAIFTDNETTERNIDVVVFNLRRKVMQVGIDIQTLRAQGYRLRGTSLTER